MRFAVALCLSSLLTAGCVAGVDEPEDVGQAAQAAHDDGSFDVDFAGCREVANVGLLPTANARPLVPAQFALLGDGAALTPFVVRTVHCDAISVNGKPAKRGDIIQIGALIVGPDGDGDINNYALSYSTSHAELAKHLGDAGVDARHVPQLEESIALNADGSGQYRFATPPKARPELTFEGPVGAPVGGPIPFSANWWSTSSSGTVKMASTFPQLFIADNGVNLSVAPGTPLAGWLGATSVTSWPILKLFDNFPSAHMHVSTR